MRLTCLHAPIHAGVRKHSRPVYRRHPHIIIIGTLIANGSIDGEEERDEDRGGYRKHGIQT